MTLLPAAHAEHAPSGASPLAAILAQAAATPAVCALRAGGFDIDYATLRGGLLRVANALRFAGVRPDDVVAVAATRTPETIIALPGILACGAACLPLDLDFPDARLAAMLADARPRVAFGSSAGHTPAIDALRWIDCDVLHGPPAPAIDIECGELAYVLFTSGSTGRPKGVAMRRAAIAHLIDWHRAHPRLGRAARTLQFAPLGFDVSFQEIFSTLATGGTLVLPTESERRDPYALLALLARERIERLFLPYVGLQALAEAVAAGGEAPSGLRDVITAGEQLRITPAIRALFKTLPGAVLHNHYGPTETHVVTAHELSGDCATWPELPPIGAPLPHVRVRIVDAALEEVARAVEGELLLGGDCLAAGYINRPELTAERFVEHRGARWYRSGDRVRADGAGSLEYLGRFDEQIKIDGFRIEPAEIEAVLCRHPALAEAVVVAAEAAGGRRLIAHVVARDPRSDERVLARLLATHCRQTLAEYLVPQAFLLHAALPLTPSGKIDRRALAQHGEQAPLHWRDGDSLQNQLLDLWQQLLSVADLDVAENLFDRGARSLVVVRALTELRRHGHVLSATQVYEHPNVAAQAALLVAAPVARDPGGDARIRGVAQRAAFARFGPHGGGSP
ncbi:MAG: amino acid adenylation domain-containing protein [Lysobacterales bacterium]